jgi:nucleoside-triphosphatase
MGLVSKPEAAKPEIIVLTGWRSVGKTTVCQKVIARARQAHQRVAGLLSPGRFSAGEKTGIQIVDLASQQTRLLASLMTGEIEGFQYGPWQFDLHALEWGNQCLRQSTGVDVLVIDEIGPLEFEQNLGWVASFEVLARKDYRLALVVIRPEFLDAFSALGFAGRTREVIPGTDLDDLAASLGATLTS